MLQTFLIFSNKCDNSRREKSGVKMCHFVMVDFNKGINVIKHNFLKRICNVGLSGTVLHAAGGSSSAHARNMPANIILMCNIQ